VGLGFTDFSGFMEEKTAQYVYSGLTIEVQPGVFKPNKTSELLVEGINRFRLEGKSALDMGCGSGIVGLAALRLAKLGSLAGSDISDKAVENAKRNAELLGVKADFKQGSLFEPWKGRKFDVIFNDISALSEPIARLSPWYPPEIHCGAGLDGAEWAAKVMEQATDYLNPGGRIIFATASLSDEQRIMDAARARFATVHTILTRSWPFRDDIWQKIMSSETARKLIDSGVVRVLKRGSRVIWDTSIHVASLEKYTVAVVGATGAVGTEMLKTLERRKFPVGRIIPLASERSAGKTVKFAGADVPVQVLDPDSFAGVDFALFSAGGAVSRQYAPIAAKAGAVVIDNSSAWRQDDRVPLVVPEVNAEALEGHSGIIANPNCSTIQMVMALKPIHDAAKIKRVIVSTYQAVSGKSGRAMKELDETTRAVLNGQLPKAELFPKPMAFNVSFDWPFDESNWFTEEEMKMTSETVKIMGDEGIKVTATTARVPVFRGHCEAIYIETEKKITAAEARDLLLRAPGIQVVDDPRHKIWPNPRDAEGKDQTFVGRIREDFTHPTAIWIWVVADNLLKGAALNAVQIAEYLVAKDHVYPEKVPF